MIFTIGLRAQSAFLITSIGTACILAIFVAAPNYAVAEPDGQKICRATGQTCFLGIDPDIYHMPLSGEIMQSGDRQICATTSGPPPLPPEAFSIDFMRNFWTTLNTSDQTNAEGAAYVFTATHWGPPAAPPSDLSAVATPADFPDEVFSSLQSRTARIEFEVPKTDFEKLGFQPAHLPVSIPPDPNPNVPLKLRGWYIRGDGLSNQDGQSNIKHPLVIVSSAFPYSIAYVNAVGGVDVGRQIRKTITYLVASGYDVLFFDKRATVIRKGSSTEWARTFFALLISLIAA